MASSFWELMLTLGLAVAGFFVPFAPHVPHSRGARIAFVLIPLALFFLSQYLWATTGRGLIERVTCLFAPNSFSCRAPPEQSSKSRPAGPSRSSGERAQPAAPAQADTGRSSGQAETTDRGSETAPPAEIPRATVRPAAPAPAHLIIPLTQSNSKDIWSTSVYSYAPGGGGPGGGLENDRLRVGGWGDQYVALIAFDLPNVDCASKVALQLYNSADSPSPTPIYLTLITSPWNWQRGDRLWWRDLPGTSSWQNRVLPAPDVNAWTTIDISDIFEKWCTKQMPNYGLMLKPVLNNNNYDAFYSTRYEANPDLRPRLVISN
jgi:hypothetical protein